MNIKTIQTDGLPGLTLQGYRGETGNKGCSTLSFRYDEPIYGAIDEADTTIGSITNIKTTQLSDFQDVCEINDYILHQKNEMTYLYRAIKISNDINEKPDAVECIDSWISDEVFDISVIIKTISKPYDAAASNNNRVTKKSTNMNFITFDVISNDVNKKLGLIKVEAEFISKDITASISSNMTDKWKSDDPSDDASNHPFGYLKNYGKIENFDNENLNNFKITIKDFSEGYNSISYSSDTKIRQQDLNGYTIKLYVYSKKSGPIMRKEYIGELNVSDL